MISIKIFKYFLIETGSYSNESEAKMPKLAKEKCLSELKKLKSMSPMSAEATVVRNFLVDPESLKVKKQSEKYLLRELIGYNIDDLSHYLSHKGITGFRGTLSVRDSGALRLTTL